MKPASIKKFDMLYLGSLVVSVLGVLLNYDAMVAASDAQLALQGIEPMGGSMLIAGLVFTIVLMLALWFLISVLRIELVKWILVLFVVYSVFVVVMNGGGGEGPLLNLILGWISTIMLVGSVYYLFRTDAKEWFAAKRGGGNSE